MDAPNPPPNTTSPIVDPESSETTFFPYPWVVTASICQRSRWCFVGSRGVVELMTRESYYFLNTTFPITTPAAVAVADTTALATLPLAVTTAPATEDTSLDAWRARV